jgi:aspartyl protease family protein
MGAGAASAPDASGIAVMRSIIVFAIAALIIGALVPRFYMKDAAAPPARAAVARPVAEPSGGRTVTLRKGDNGHFQTAAIVDGRQLDFLVDTGASAIILRESEAARLGIFPSARDYTTRLSTANGVIMAAPVALNRVEVGGLVVYDVAAIVLPDEALAQNLLGMSFLSKVRWEHRNGLLVLEQ